MNRIIKYITIILFLSIIWKPNILESCTAFCLNKECHILVGKNLDWPIGDCFILINKKGVSKFSLVNPGEKPARWHSKYGSVTFNQFGKEFPLGGMNEEGLVVEELSYSPSVYPKNNTLCSLNELQWIQYQLDNYSTVEEVIENLSRLQLSKFLFGLHYFICDRFGNTAVIEFIHGKALCYHGDHLPVEVLSNNSYQNSLKYLELHKGFGGDRIPTNRPESQERFVRATFLLKNYGYSKNAAPNEYAFSILDNVKQTDTQWSIIYNPIQLTIAYKIKGLPEKQSLNFINIDFSDTKQASFFTLGNHCTANTLLQCFSELSEGNNKTLLEIVFQKLVNLKEIEKSTASFLVKKCFLYHQRLEK